MIRIKHDEIEGLWGALPFTALARGTKECIDHLDQRGGPYHRVELVKPSHVEGVKGVTKETVSARQAERWFSLMGALLLRPRLVAQRILVPGQHEKIYGLVWHHSLEVSGAHFDVLQRHSQGIDRLANGLEYWGKRRAVERAHHGEKPPQFRADVFLGAQLALRRANMEGFPP